MQSNPRIAELFSRSVRPDGKGGWVIDVGIDRQPCIVQDTALVVVSVDGDPATGLQVRANDGITDELDPATLRIGNANVAYCTLERGERGRIEARLLRPAYYRLAGFLEEDGDGAVLRYKGRSYRLRRSN